MFSDKKKYVSLHYYVFIIQRKKKNYVIKHKN